MTDWPMPPAPMTTTVWPGCTLARLSTAPVPVTTAQPMRHATSSGTDLSITTACVSLTTVCSLNTPALANWNAFSPPTVNGRGSLPKVSRQCVGWPRSHASHWPQLPSVVSTTWSPTCDLLHRAADLLDDAGALVTHHDRRRERDRAVEHRDVAVAQAGVVDADLDLVRPRPAHLDVVADLELARPDDRSHRRSSRRRAPRVRAQDLSGQAGVLLQLAVEHDGHAVDDGGVRALGLRRPPAGAVGEVVHELLVRRADRVRIEDRRCRRRSPAAARRGR